MDDPPQAAAPPSGPPRPSVAAVAPWVVVDGAAGLLDFVVAAFAAQELGRVPGPDDVVGHAEVVLGGTRVVVMDAREGWVASPARLRLEVVDLPAHLDRARRAGGEVTVGPHRLPTGELMAVVRDAWGGRWWLTEQVERLEVTELIARLQAPGAAEAVAAYEAEVADDQRRG